MFQHEKKKKGIKFSTHVVKCLNSTNESLPVVISKRETEFCSFASLFHLQTIGADYAVCCGNYLCLLHAKQREMFAQWTRECLRSIEICQELLKENSARNFSDKAHDKVPCRLNTTCSSKLILACSSWKSQHNGIRSNSPKKRR